MFDFVIQRPYLQFALALACGTALGAHCVLPLPLLRDDWWLWLVLALGLAGLWWEWRGRLDVLSSLPGFALLALIGFLNGALALALPLAQPLRAYAAQLASESGAIPLQRLSGKVVSLPKYQNGHLRCMLAVDKARPWVRLPRLPEGSSGPLPRARFPDWEPARGTCFVFIRCDAVPDLQPGDRLQLSATLEEVAPPRNLGQFDYRGYLLQRGTVLTAYAPSVYSLKRTNTGRNAAWVALARLRARLTGELERRLPPELGDLAISTVYGDKITDVNDGLTERFRRAGLSHILVASGTQVSLLIGLLLMLGWRSHSLGVSLLRSLLTLAGVLTYAALAGLETSIVRALVMGGVVLLARLLRRDADGLSSLAQAAIVLLLIAPLQILSAGFQLSFAATFGLIYLNGITLPLLGAVRQAAGETPLPAPPGASPPGWGERLKSGLARRLPGLRHGLTTALSTTLGAQIFVVPVLASQFCQLSIWGLFSNALAVPLSFILLLGGALLSFGLGALPLVGPCLISLVVLSCRALDSWAALFAALPGSDLAVPRLAAWQIAVVYCTLLAGGEWAKLGLARTSAGASAALERQSRLLAWSVAAGGLSVLAGLMCWLLVPREELAELALPGSAAFLWRASDGGSWLLVQPRGLQKSRNSDTLAAALRVRGINRLRALVWLDTADPAAEPLPELPGPRFNLSRLPRGAGRSPSWIYTDTRCVGAGFQLGQGSAVALWDVPAAGFVPAERASHPPGLVMSPADVAGRCQRGLVERLAADYPVALVDARGPYLPRKQVISANGATAVLLGSELRVHRAAGGALRFSSGPD